MDTVLELILNFFNTGIGVVGSSITIYDHFKNVPHTEEVFAAMRTKSKAAYDSYCEYQRYRKNDIGIPLEEDILGYWNSCLRRNTLPGAADMVSQNIASKEEADILSAYLLEAWMEVPDFVQWLNSLSVQNKMDELSRMLMVLQKSVQGVSKLANELKRQNINEVAFIISPDRIVDAKYSCTESDIRNYFMVDNRFATMFKVISAGRAVPRTEAESKMRELTESSRPVIIAGNGGLGKTSLMMYTAVQWASCGEAVVWLSLSNENIITEQKAASFFDGLAASISAGQRILVCIDNPYEGRISFSNLQKTCPDNAGIQLIMAERANRLTFLADPDQDFLLHWFDDAQMIILQGLEQCKPTFELKDYISFPFPETQKRREKILEQCTLFLEREGSVEEKDRLDSIQMILKKYGKPNVSLVELIYRTLFELKKRASKPESIKLDWEEWGSLIESEFGKGRSYTQKDLYGVIAALNIFSTPITVPLFCKYFDINERKLRNYLNQRLVSCHSEPVILKNDILRPKHDVVAELFFLFHEKTVSINSLMTDLLQCMDEDETEALLKNMVNKREFEKRKKYHVGQIAYRKYMDTIYSRLIKSECNLSDAGKAYLCLGYLWSESQKKISRSKFPLQNILDAIAPETDGTLLLAKLYTEWGIWAGTSGDFMLAEEKLRTVVDRYPTQLPARTELGRLLSKQKGREKEAEAILREAIEIDPKNLQSRTELGRLLSKQKGREKEAEAILREAIQIDPQHIQSRTELGRLLSKQKGREREAERYLKEVIEIDPKNLHARTVLAKLYEDSGRQQEAVKLYQEVCRYNPGNVYGESGLERLREYIKE